MATQTFGIITLLNQIRTDQQLVLPDIQRDFVWSRDQIRLLMDSIMRGYPFGSLLVWQTRFLQVPYREFVIDYLPSATFVPKTKEANVPLRMVLDGQQRLQSLYIGVYGSHEHRRLYFNVTSGETSDDADDTDTTLGATYRFEFWRDDDSNRPKRLILLSRIIGWPPRSQDDRIEDVIKEIGLDGDDANRARSNMRLVRQVMHQSDLVPVEMIDEDATDATSARSINEILEIFVRVNTGGTRLSRSDLMFSLLKSKWKSARLSFDELLREVEKKASLGLDKDFVIRGLLTVADASPKYEVENVERNWTQMEAAFDQFCMALKSGVDFCQSADVGIRSRSLFDPSILFPVVYYLYHFRNGSLPDDQRKPLRCLLYFLLFNRFLRRPEARIRYLRGELQKHKGKPLPLEELLAIIAAKQTHHYITTTLEMLNNDPRLTLNIAQPAVCRDTLSWQEQAEVDHIFPQSVMRPKFPSLVDDVGNYAYLGKLRNIRKSDQMPADYFKDVTDAELRDDYLIDDRTLLAEDQFEQFIQARRNRLIQRVKDYLGR